MSYTGLGFKDDAFAMQKARETLGVGACASQAEIRSKWRRMVGEARRRQDDARVMLNELDAALNVLTGRVAGKPFYEGGGLSTVVMKRPTSKPLEELTHVRPDYLKTSQAPELAIEVPQYRTHEEDQQIADLVRKILKRR